jgi:hypothetical protein
MGGGCGTYGREEVCIQDFGWETCGKEPLVRLRRKREDDIKMHFQELE